MKYWVTMRIDGRFTCEVEANSLEEARDKAAVKYYDADFGELECIDAEAVNAETEDGILWDYC